MIFIADFSSFSFSLLKFFFNLIFFFKKDDTAFRPNLLIVWISPQLSMLLCWLIFTSRDSNFRRVIMTWSWIIGFRENFCHSISIRTGSEAFHQNVKLWTRASWKCNFDSVDTTDWRSRKSYSAALYTDINNML